MPPNEIGVASKKACQALRSTGNPNRQVIWLDTTGIFADVANQIRLGGNRLRYVRDSSEVLALVDSNPESISVLVIDLFLPADASDPPAEALACGVAFCRGLMTRLDSVPIVVVTPEYLNPIVGVFGDSAPQVSVVKGVDLATIQEELSRTLRRRAAEPIFYWILLAGLATSIVTAVLFNSMLVRYVTAILALLFLSATLMKAAGAVSSDSSGGQWVKLLNEYIRNPRPR